MDEKFNMFTVQISRLNRLVRKIKSREIAKLAPELKGSHVSCLYYIYKSECGVTAKDICDMGEEDKAIISRSLDFLEKNGFIYCESKTEKRYKSILLLTDKGMMISEKISDIIDKIVDDASVGLKEEDRIIFYKTMNIIDENLQKICDKCEEEV